eukprot:s4658_g1.t1
MEAVSTLLNISDMGTKRLTKPQRAFLMYLMGVVHYDEASNSYMAVGEIEFNEEIRKRAMAKNMKAVRSAMLSTLVDGAENINLPLATNLVKVVALLAMQPVVTGINVEETEVTAIGAKETYYEVFANSPVFMAIYAAIFVFIGFAVGYYFKTFVYDERIGTSGSNGDGGARGRSRRRRARERRIETDISMVNELTMAPRVAPLPAAASLPMPTLPEPPEQVPEEHVSLPGSPKSDKSDDVPDIPMVGLDWENMEVLLAHLPPGQRHRAKMIREVSLFSEHSFKEFLLCHLMVLYPGQPDLNFDFPLWWNRQDQHEYRVFNEIVIHKHCLEGWGSFCEQWFIHQDGGFPPGKKLNLGAM